MGFLHPWFLLLGLGILIPVAIHLFNFHRFKQVLFTNVRFLQSIAAENKKQNKLLERLLLMCRCLTVLLLALLFAQPYIKNSENQLVKEGNNAVVIVVDNSFSMQNASQKGSMLDAAKQKAAEILNEYSDNDVFCLLTQDLEGRHKHFVTRQTFADFLKDVEISPCSRKYSELINTAHHLLALRNENSKRVFFISDFQQQSFDAQNIKKDSLIRDVFLPLEVANINNIYVDSLTVNKNIFLKGQQVDLTVRIKNASDSDAEKLTVKLFVDDKQMSLSSCDIKANSSVEIPFSFVLERAGAVCGRIHIIDNPITYDDDFYFTINAGERIKILSLNGNGENPYLNRLFANSSEVVADNMNESAIDFSVFSSYSLIILNGLKNITTGLTEQLNKYRQNAGTLVVIPCENMDVKTYSSAMAAMQMPLYTELNTTPSKVAQIDIDNRIFKKVFTSVTDNMEMPQTEKYYKIKNGAQTSKQDIMLLANGDAFMVENTVNHSSAYIFATPFDDKWTDFIAQSVFVPVMWNIALYSAVLPNVYMFTNSKEPVDLSDYIYEDGDPDFYLLGETIDFIQRGTQNKFIAGHTVKGYREAVYLPDGIKDAGFYDIKCGKIEMRTLALNYPREESELRFMDSKAVDKELKKINYDNYSVFNDRKMIKTYFSQSKQGFNFTFLLLIAAFLCIVAESAIIYKMKQ